MEGEQATKVAQSDEEYFSADEADTNSTDDSAEPSEVTATKGEATPRGAAVAATVDEESECESDGLSEEERVQKATDLKNKGNSFYGSDNEAAIVQYREGLRICPKSARCVRAQLYANMAAVYVMLEDNKKSVELCDKAIRYDETYTKAYLRRGKSHEKLDNLDKALEDFQKVLELEPGNSTAQEGSQRVMPLIAERNEKMKEEVLGKLKELGNCFLKPFGMSTDNFKLQQDPTTGGYSVNFQK